MGATLLVSVIIIATQPREVFWGSDSGSRFIQMQTFLRTGGIAIEHRFPLGHHFINVGGKTYSMWGPAFPVVASPFYAALGTPGLFVLPIAGTLLLIALLPMLTQGSISANGVLLVFGTPFLWYSVVFWEHSLAAAIAVAAFILAERERPLIAGVLAGVSTLFREEGYIAIAAIGMAIVVTRRAPRQAILFGAGTLMPLIPWWSINWTMFGNPLGLHAAVYSSIARGGKLSNFFPFLFEFSSVRPANVLLVLPAIALVLLSPFPVPSRIRVTLFALTAAAFAALTFLFLRSTAPVRETLYLQGLFPAIPFSAAIFLSLPRLWTERRFRTVAVLGGIVLTTLAVNQSDFGVLWGPRHYLWLVPLMMVLAVESLARTESWIAIGAAVLLVAISFIIQFAGIGILRGKLRFSEQVLQAVRADPAHVVLTDVFWIPEELAAVFYEKEFGFVRNDRELTAALKAIGQRSFLFVAARQFRLVSNRGFATLLPRVTRRRRIAGIDPMLDVMLLEAAGRLH
jgi:hypothetical protein